MTANVLKDLIWQRCNYNGHVCHRAQHHLRRKSIVAFHVLLLLKCLSHFHHLTTLRTDAFRTDGHPYLLSFKVMLQG